MTRYLLDTGIATENAAVLASFASRVKAARLRGDRVGLGTPVLGELIAGIQNSNDPPRHLTTMWRNIAHLALWSFDKAAAIEFGRLYAELRRAGRTLQVPDL